MKTVLLVLSVICTIIGGTTVFVSLVVLGGRHLAQDRGGKPIRARDVVGVFDITGIAAVPVAIVDLVRDYTWQKYKYETICMGIGLSILILARALLKASE